MTDLAGLTLDGVGHDFDGAAVVREVSLKVRPGELICLLGPSGCGKTTTLRIAAGLERPTQGRVLLDGRLVSGGGTHIPPESRQVGFLFQDYALFPHLDVLGNVEFGLTALPRDQRRAQAMRMLEQVGMAAHSRAWPHQLSGGQQQRVALARALAPGPRLLLLDEPFSGLDKRLRDQVRDETLEVLRTNRVATLMVTHDPEEAMFMADRIAIMRGGRIVQMGTPEDLYSRPVDTFAAAVLDEINILAGRVENGAVTTPLGVFAAPLLPEGAAVQVVFRPDALELSPDPTGPVTVLTIRKLGRSTLLHLRLELGDGSAHLHARIAGPVAVEEGQIVRPRVAADRAMIFAAS